jgi:hypothetical protein
MKQTAVEWLFEQFFKVKWDSMPGNTPTIFEQAKAMESEQKGYTEEEAKQIWKAGQEYWKTSGSSITFEELTETFNAK